MHRRRVCRSRAPGGVGSRRQAPGHACRGATGAVAAPGCTATSSGRRSPVRPDCPSVIATRRARLGRPTVGRGDVLAFFEQCPAQRQPDALSDLGADLVGARRQGRARATRSLGSALDRSQQTGPVRRAPAAPQPPLRSVPRSSGASLTSSSGHARNRSPTSSPRESRRATRRRRPTCANGHRTSLNTSMVFTSARSDLRRSTLKVVA